MASAKKEGNKPAIKENDRRALFALLAVIAVALVAYAVFFYEPADTPSDIDTFVAKAMASDRVGLFLDARGADVDSARIVFQCGVDIAGGQLFGSKTLSTYACDDKECVAVNSAQNGSSTLTYDQVKKGLRTMPYIAIKSGTPDTKFFANHAEISVDESFGGSCRLG
jgi:hypothetical protein